MNAICGMTKVLKSFHISREQKECVQIISSSAKALLSLLNNILDFSKIEAGKTEINVRLMPSLKHSRLYIVCSACSLFDRPAHLTFVSASTT